MEKEKAVREAEDVLAAHPRSGIDHTHWIVIAYAHMDPVSGQCSGAKKLDVIADSYNEALQRAEVLIPRASFPDMRNAGYTVTDVIDHVAGACGH